MSFAKLLNTRVVNLYKAPYDVYIGRKGQQGKWGNPFNGPDRLKNITDYKNWILQQPELLTDLEELRGKRLGCFCKPKACHGDVLVELLEGI